MFQKVRGITYTYFFRKIEFFEVLKVVRPLKPMTENNSLSRRHALKIEFFTVNYILQ